MGQYSFMVSSATIRGVKAIPVSVEVVVSAGIPSFSIVGMPDIAIQESKERIRAAIRSSGFQMPRDKIVVNLAPGSVKKHGSGFDLPIALGLLAATGQINPSVLDNTLVVGELSLDGTARATEGLLAFQRCAKEQGLSLLVGMHDAAVSRMEVETFCVSKLADVLQESLNPLVCSTQAAHSYRFDFAEVKGHEAAKRALQIAAAGNHGALMVGPPGSGKTMLARCYPSILPPLSEEERLDSALIYSVLGLDVNAVLSGVRPFRNPHHSITQAGLLGGGNPVKPGEISLAHNGVLFLDELAEFKSSVLQALRQPFEEGVVRLARADGIYEFPSSFNFLAATNPCPCGYYGDYNHDCKCSESQIRTYQNRIGGPLLDRIDIQIDVWPLEEKVLLSSGSSIDSAFLRDGVLCAREFAQWRFEKEGKPKGLDETLQSCHLSDESLAYFKTLMKTQKKSARSVIKTLLLARTIADINQEYQVSSRDISEAFMLRLGGLFE